MSDDDENAVTVVAIALVAHDGCYLVGRRGPAGPLAGYYEFPGGKCLPGEPPEACATRECREETGLDVQVIRLRRTVKHTYPYGTVHLHFFDCRLARDHAPLTGEFIWVPVSQIRKLIFPEPNGPLIDDLLKEAEATTTQKRQRMNSRS